MLRAVTTTYFLKSDYRRLPGRPNAGTPKFSRRIAPWLLAALIAWGGACSRQAAPPAPSAPSAPENTGPEQGPEAPRPLALIRPGPVPLWFELGPGGPVQIPGPDEASLVPWAPWTAAPFVTELIPSGDSLVMAVNRRGFLVWVPGEAGALYGVDLSAAWDPFTVGGVFYIEGFPAALLYRDRVFRDGDGGPETAERVWVLPAGSFEARPGSVPAFEGIDALREITVMRLGREDSWYFRAEGRSAETNSAWFRGGGLSGPAEPVDFGVFRNAVRPYTIDDAPGPLRALLKAGLDGAESGETPLARVFFSGLGPRYYGAEGGAAEEAPGFYRLTGLAEGQAGNQEAEAALLLTSGRGLYAIRDALGEFELPALPEGFVYTRLGPGGNGVLIAAWEERQDWNVAAAGFLVVTAPETAGGL